MFQDKKPKLICRLKGGLGNQIFQYACILSISKSLGLEAAFDISLLTHGDAVGRRVEIDSIFENFTEALPCCNAPIIRAEAINEIKQDIHRYLDNGLMVIMLDGYYQKEDFFLPIAEEIKSDLVKFRNKKLSGIEFPKKKRYAVGVHLRRHDYQHFGLCADAYYLETLSWFIRKYSGDVEFFVCSDEALYTVDLIKPLAKQAPITLINTGDHVLDFFLLSTCDHFVIANSTYSWWAAYLGEVVDRTIVFAPANPWILMTDLDPCPSRWCKVSGVVARNQWPTDVKEKVQWARFTASYNQFQTALTDKPGQSAFQLDPSQLFPCMEDEVENHPVESHYLYHPAWAVRKLIEYKVTDHYDFGSTLHFASMASAITRLTLHDLRPPKIFLSNLECRSCDLMQIDYPDDSLPSISCMHTIEHIGLGRYGDKLNPLGDRMATSELSRILKPGGFLFFVVPVGYPRMQFNAHRIYSFELVLSLFPELALLEHSLIPDNAIDIGMLDQPSAAIIDRQIHGCGCFIFRKPEKP